MGTSFWQRVWIAWVVSWMLPKRLTWQVSPMRTSWIDGVALLDLQDVARLADGEALGVEIERAEIVAGGDHAAGRRLGRSSPGSCAR